MNVSFFDGIIEHRPRTGPIHDTPFVSHVRTFCYLKFHEELLIDQTASQTARSVSDTHRTNVKSGKVISESSGGGSKYVPVYVRGCSFFIVSRELDFTFTDIDI